MGFRFLHSISFSAVEHLLVNAKIDTTPDHLAQGLACSEGVTTTKAQQDRVKNQQVRLW